MKDIHMPSLTSYSSSLQEIILSDQHYLSKARDFVNFLRFLDEEPRQFSPNFSLIIRPHGFGMSLALESMEAMLMRDELISEGFSAKHSDELDMPKAPALRLSLKHLKATNPQELTEALIDIMQVQMWRHHIKRNITNYSNPKACFAKLLEDLEQKYQDSIVVLIDNYELPLYLASLMPKNQQETAISIYFDMLNAIKQAGPAVKWCLLSGHSKFALANNISEGIPLINDLSFSERCDTLFGFTLDEISEYFDQDLKILAPRQGLTVNELKYALNKCYGGFVFSKRQIPVLCSASVNRALYNEGALYPYTYHSEFTFIRDTLKKEDPDLSWFFNRDGQDAVFENTISLEPTRKDLGALLLQYGFAAIDKITTDEGPLSLITRYRYNCPNVEMRRILKILQGKASPKLAEQRINPQVFEDGENDFDIEE